MPETSVTEKLLRAPELGASAFAEAKALIGMPIRVELWSNEATWDTIRRYAWGLGDDNPLYCDPAYAEKTKWGTLIAPPTFFYSVFDAVVAPGLPDIQWFYAGTDWTFERQARRGDAFAVKADYVDAKEVSGDSGAKALLQTGKVQYFNQHGTHLATALSHCFRIPRKSAKGGLDLAPRETHRYTADELEDIGRRTLAEFRRGAETLYFEDVKVGDLIPGTIRGPLSQLDMTCYYAGSVGTSGYKASKLRWKYREWALHDPGKLPNNYDPSYFGAAISPSIGHQIQAVAQGELGMPGAYDNGPQRIGMIATAATNWMGDDGFLRELGVRLKKPVIFGDTVFTKGQVVSVRQDKGVGLVEAELRAENQLGDTTATGRALIELPLRTGGEGPPR